jgi:xylose isomerase
MPTLQFSTRLNSFALGKGMRLPGGDESILDLIAIAGTVKGLTAVELNYPEHFEKDSVEDIRAALVEAGLTNLGIQLRWPAPLFAGGAFTNVDPSIRAKAVELVLEAVKVGRALGSTHILMWPAHDGYEYPLQMDYVMAWTWMIECLVEVADSAPDVRFSIEYKPAEPRARTILNTTGAVMKLIADVGRPNLGVTLDFGHLLMARENPGQSAAMALRDKKMFGLQLNDSYGHADDGLLVGSIHLAETLELAYYLVRDGYTGTFYFDTDPVRENPVRECEANIRRMTALMAIAAKLVEAHPGLPCGDALLSADTTWSMLVGD